MSSFDWVYKRWKRPPAVPILRSEEEAMIAAYLRSGRVTVCAPAGPDQTLNVNSTQSHIRVEGSFGTRFMTVSGRVRRPK